MTKKIAIIVTGDPPADLRSQFGTFDRWFIATAPDNQFCCHRVFVGDPPPDPKLFNGIIITGSPAMVTDRQTWSEQLKPWIRAVVEQSIPLLAVCYGHQLLADAFGGTVDYHPQGREIGTVAIERTHEGATDPLFGNLGCSFLAHVTHAQSVRSLPSGAVLLAANEFEPHHGFRLGSNAWGLQFHPEFNLGIMGEYIRYHQRFSGLDDDITAKLLDNLQDAAQAATLVKRFIELC